MSSRKDFRSDTMLASICQRIPAISHMIIGIITIFGPTYCPLLYTIMLLVIHVIMCITIIETVYGTYCAWRGVEHCWKTDWYTLCERALLDTNHNVVNPSRLTFNMIEHIIIIPIYQENLTILRETLDILASHSYAKTNYRVCLAMEERETGAQKKADILINKYQNLFLEITNSLHPTDLKGEMAGKSSNVNWATRFMYNRLPSNDQCSCQIITVIDSDTALAQDYFGCVTARYCIATSEDRVRMMFVTPMIFDRNAHKVPIFVKLTDIIWSMAALSTIYPTSLVKIPASVYSISMDLAISVDFWDAGPEAIGEDFHMLIKCFLSTGGHLKMETIYSPASQLNVVGKYHERGWIGYLYDLKARYTQSVRHMWGALDVGYALRRVLSGNIGELCVEKHLHTPDKRNKQNENFKDSTIESKKILKLRTTQVQYSITFPFPSSLQGQSTQKSLIDSVKASHESAGNSTIKIFRVVILLLRLFQAHIMPGWMFSMIILPQLFLISNDIKEFVMVDSRLDYFSLHYTSASPSFNLKLSEMLHSATWIVFFDKFFRLVRFIWIPLIVAAYLMYCKVHHITAVCRWDAVHKKKLGLRPKEVSIYHMPWSILNLLALPGCVLFSIIPLFHAQGLHLFTHWLIYIVALKSPSSTAIVN